MNKIHRTVWNEARQCYVVASETAKAKGKASSSRAGVVPAVAAALLALGSGQALAADICTGGGLTTISTAQTVGNNCDLGVGESVVINATGSISATGYLAWPVTVNQISGAVSISNAGTLTGGESAVYISGSTVTGGLINAAGGVISGQYGIRAITANNTTTIGNGISNTGLIQGSNRPGIQISGNGGTATVAGFATVTGGIYNAAGATIKSDSSRGIEIGTNTTVSGGITNEGTIMGTTSGTGLAIRLNQNPPNYARVDGITIAGSNTAKFVGEVFAYYTPVILASGAIYTMDSPSGLQKFSVESFTNAGTLKIGATTTGQILNGNGGNFTNTGTFSPMVASGSSFGKLTVAGTATVAGAMAVYVDFSDTTACGGLTGGGTLAGVLTSTDVLTVTGGTLAGTVTHNCTTPITISTVKSGNSINLVASAPPTWPVTGASGGNGTVSCVTPVNDSATATCTGTASGGYYLASAAGCGTPTVSGNTITVGPITAACTVTGTFAPITWPVTGASGGNGTVNCVSPANEGSTATCTGTASGGYQLNSAAGSSTLCGTVSVSGTSITAGPVTGACTVTGSFGLIPPSTYAITTAASPTAGGTVACSPNPVTSGSSSTCTGTANPGYTFSTFSGDCTGPTCVLTNVTSAKSVTGAFTQNNYAITATASPTAGGTVTCTPSSVTYGNSSTCTGTANPGYTFSTFSGDCTGPTCVLPNVTAAKSVTANFTVSNANGTCGGAAGVASAVVPNANLCAPGSTPGLVAASSGGFNWSCTGTGISSTPAQCTAPGAAAPAGGGTVTFEPLSGGCSISSLTLGPPPTGGPGNGVVMPFGVVNFTLESCTENTARVRTTYSSSVAAMQFWKYLNSSWIQVRSDANLVISGNSVTFDIVDNGPYDADPTPHVIADPGGPGYVPTATTEPTVPEVPVVPLIPPLASLPALPGVGNSGRVFLNLAEGAGPSMTGCLRTTLNDLLGPDWLYQGQSADGGARLSRATDIISYYPIEASSNTTYGLGQGAGIYLRNTNPLSIVTNCGTFVTAPALYNLGEFGALLNAGGLTAQINAQGVITYPTGSLTYSVRPSYWVTQGNPAAPALTTGTDGQLRFTDSAGHSQILYPAFLDPELLGTQVSQAVGGWTVVQTDGTALLTLLNGQKFVLTPDLALGTVPPEILTVWWQDGPNHYSFRNSGFSNTSQGFSVTPR